MTSTENDVSESEYFGSYGKGIWLTGFDKVSWVLYIPFGFFALCRNNRYRPGISFFEKSAGLSEAFKTGRYQCPSYSSHCPSVSLH